MFGEIPAYGFFIRHVNGLKMDNVEVSYLKDDLRPAFWLHNVNGAEFFRVRAQRRSDVPTFLLKDVEDFSVVQSHPIADTRLDKIKEGRIQ